jgi:hypothetical protein
MIYLGSLSRLAIPKTPAEIAEKTIDYAEAKRTRAEFESAQRVEQRFHRDFDG